ncbi:MAG: hypothetical protein AABX86_00400 [Nanoarchaeota archaeon]
MTHMCSGCSRVCGWLFLIVGILFLLDNLTAWSFWGIQWYTVAFILFGIGAIGASKCSDCQAMMPGRKK